MYKVVIVDDEQIIVDGLRKIVNWGAYDCQVVGTANTGRKGLELIREKNPDILFTDIRMPQMDGLAMIAAIRSEHQDMQISILTGYREFEYAREALRLGVNRFLLKPSRMKELNEAMEAMTANLKKAGAVEQEQVVPEQKAEETDKPATVDEAGNFVVKKAMEYIRAHYNEKIQLTDVAEAVYVSHWHLSKLLNKTLDKSFSDILNETRIKQAQVLMQDSSLHIGDIAEKVGFNDAAHFARVFKKYTGMSANEYRNQHT